MTPESKIARVPFLRITVAMVAGIIASRYVDAPLWCVGVCTAVCYLFAWLGIRRAWGWWYVTASIVLSAMFMGTLRRSEPRLPTQEAVYVSFRAADSPVKSGRWWLMPAIVGQYRMVEEGVEGGGVEFDDYNRTEDWTRCDEQVILYVDTCYSVDYYRDMMACGFLYPIDTVGSSYGDLMRARGFHSRMYVSRGNLLAASPTLRKSPRYYARALQSSAAERLAKLELPDSLSSVASAMVVGRKGDMNPLLRQDYSRVGASHLLAVSGLHVGIVFLLVNALLYFMPVFRWGFLLRNVLAVVAIWIYAATSGLSPSVVRAALMFSAAQIAITTGGHRSALNVMLGSAAVMLAVDPNYLYDISFQLSYAAVLSIVSLYPWIYGLVAKPLHRFVSRRSRISKVARMGVKSIVALWAVMTVGVAASVGTAPLVAYYFGNLPLVGVVINPAVIFTAHLIVLGSVVWIIAPFALLQPVASFVVGGAAWLQNCVVAWSAGLEWAGASVRLSLWQVMACYAVLIALAVVINMREAKKELSLHE